MQNQKLSLTVIIFIISILSVYTQSNSINIVKEYYPQIYNSIKTETEKQWSNDKKILNTIMEGQARAFLEMAESQTQIDPVAMTNALLYGSLPNEEEYNRRIIDDLNITNPYPLLKCNWSIVKTQYEKTKNIIPGTHSDKNMPKPMPSENMDKFKDEIYGGGIRSSKKSKATGKASGLAKNREFYKGGISLDLGLSSITGLSDWDRNANPGKLFEASFWLRNNWSNSYFLSVHYSSAFIHHSVTDNYNNKTGNLDQFTQNAYLYFGFYYHLSSSTTLLLGLGGFAGVNLATDKAAYIVEEVDIHPNSNDLSEFNYGLSGLLAIQVNRYEFALRPNWGLADMSRDSYGFKSRTISLSIGYLF